jgi:hypothetical protein
MRDIDREMLDAIHRGDSESAARCLAQGANDLGVTALVLAIPRSASAAIALLQAGADPNDPSHRDFLGRMPIHRAVLLNDDVLVTHLLVKGADPNVADRHGCTPSHDVFYQGNFRLANLLVLNGADLERRDIIGKTPIDLAMMMGHRDLALYFERHGRRHPKPSDNDRDLSMLAFLRP